MIERVIKMGKRLNIKPGDRYFRWTVMEEAEQGYGTRRFRCQCDCGNISTVRLTHLRQGVSKSCGCLAKELSTERATKHGYSFNPLTKVWRDMKRRCFNPKHKRYKDWGGRGITVCKDWRDLETFIKWAENNGYKPGLLLDRKDNDGNYEPSNCRWTTMKEQANNRRNNKLITYKGVTMTQAQWAEFIGIEPMTLSCRLKRGWPIDKALETPLQTEYSRKVKTG